MRPPAPQERELCATSRLHPAHYLALKDMMLRDAERHGAISRQEVSAVGVVGVRAGVGVGRHCGGGARPCIQPPRRACMRLCGHMALVRARRHTRALRAPRARPQARTFFRLDPQRCLRLYDLWLSLGWVTAPA